ncbi:MAG: hypothetical protein M2R45_04589 [Verrucomicrobia subdivision 3 bacterium]|nr:hypothetical protein [Limisphaerales bacterium]MCS1417364.1 hypothetical protein [Limisphaerales bacterium]
MPVFQGVIGLEDAVPKSGATEAKNIQLTILYLKEMHTDSVRSVACSSLSCCCPVKRSRRKLVASLYQSERQLLDLSRILLKFFALDGHLNTVNHQMLAERIGTSWIHNSLQALPATRDP